MCDGRSRNLHMPQKLEIAHSNSSEKVNDFWFLNGKIYHVIFNRAVWCNH